MRVLFSRPAGKIAIAAVVVFVFYAGFHATGRFAPVHFSTATEARQFFLAKGLHCHDANVCNLVGCVFLVADHQLTSDDISAIPCKSRCGMTPQWKGILWVNQMNCPGSFTKLEPLSIGGKSRIWGNLLVAGDEELMERIEQCFRDR